MQLRPPITEAAVMTKGARGQTLYTSKKSDKLFPKQTSPCSQSIAAAQSPTPQPLHYWHVIDGAGTSHQTQCEFKDFSPLPLGEGVAPIFADKLQDTPAPVVIAQLPKGWIGAWHENPKPQWIVPLSGHWFVETTDGHRVEMGPIPCSP